MASSIIDLLERLGISRCGELRPYHPRVRDRDDVAVLRCPRSGVIVLSRTDHVSLQHYNDEQYEDAITAEGLRHEPAILDDAIRRQALYRDFVRGRRWLDFGTGPAAILGLMGGDAACAVGVEPNRRLRLAAQARGLRVVGELEELGAGECFDVITLFHVFEHLLDPVETMRQIAVRLAPGGLVIAEVPHARDFLLETLDSEAFRRFTLWSEHLILHTRESLSRFLGEAGLGDIAVRAQQRYPLSNHLHWLRHERPGGHAVWGFLDSPALLQAYEASLAALDQTDTLVAFARPSR